jgi:hypothetical protein
MSVLPLTSDLTKSRNDGLARGEDGRVQYYAQQPELPGVHDCLQSAKELAKQKGITGEKDQRPYKQHNRRSCFAVCVLWLMHL